MKKITLSLLLALGITGAYADGVYLNSQYGISNNNGHTFSASLGYNQSLSNGFFVNTNIVTNYTIATLSVNYIDPTTISSSYKFNHALSIAWMLGAGYNFTKNLSLMADAGVGNFSEAYTKIQSYFGQNGEILNTSHNYYLSGSIYPVPFLSLQAKYDLTSKISLIATYQYMITQSNFVSTITNTTLTNFGINQLLAGLQFTF